MAAALGFDIHVLGGRDRFDLVEAHARLWIQLAFNLGRRWGFVLSESGTTPLDHQRTR